VILKRELVSGGMMEIRSTWNAGEFIIKLEDKQEGKTYTTVFRLSDVETKRTAYTDPKTNKYVPAEYYIPYSGVGTKNALKVLVQEDVYTALSIASKKNQDIPQIVTQPSNQPPEEIEGTPIIRNKKTER